MPTSVVSISGPNYFHCVAVMDSHSLDEDL